jgi:GTP cyclohydrolase FolE2
MKGIQRLVRIRTVQEQAAQRALIDANVQLNKTLISIDIVRRYELVSASAKTSSLMAGHMESLADASITLMQSEVFSAKLAAKAQNQLLLVQFNHECYRLAHSDWRRADTLLKAEMKAESAYREKRIQKQADDFYLSKMRRKNLADCGSSK